MTFLLQQLKPVVKELSATSNSVPRVPGNWAMRKRGLNIMTFYTVSTEQNLWVQDKLQLQPPFALSETQMDKGLCNSFAVG